MKNGTAYAAKLKKVYAKQKQLVGPVEVPESGDAMVQLAEGILGIANGVDFAHRLVSRMLTNVVGWNEARVSNVFELQRAAGDSVESHKPYYERLLRALQSVYDHENKMSLDRLRSIGRREGRSLLESLDGVDEYAVASVILWSLGGHAIPVCDRLLETLKTADVVHPDASRAEVQAFLERHIPAAEAKTFCLTMRSFTAPKRGAKTSAKKTTKKTTKASGRSTSSKK